MSSLIQSPCNEGTISARPASVITGMSRTQPAELRATAMSAASCLLSEDQFWCSICLDVFTDPVTIPCGHNFCKSCITRHWDVNDLCVCPLCEKIFDRRPELHVNTFISEVASQFRHSARKKARRCLVQTRSTSEDVLCDVCSETKQKALKSCLMCLTSYCETHLEPHHRIPGLKKHELIDPVENLEDRMCKIHDRPLEMFCKNDKKCVCFFCHESNHKSHLCIPIVEEYCTKKDEMVNFSTEMQNLIQGRRMKIEQLKQSMNADKETEISVQVFTAVVQTVERELAEHLDLVKEKQKKTEKQAKGYIKKLEMEISELTKRRAEVENFLQTEDRLRFLQSFPSINYALPTKDWTKVRVQSWYEGTLRKAVDQLQDTVSKEVEKLYAHAELKMVQKYAVDITLDPDTAHPCVDVLYNDKYVYLCEKKDLPDNPERFFLFGYVLGRQGFSSGKFYYEVEVGSKTRWEIGVAKESIERKVGILLNPERGFWALLLNDGGKFTTSGAAFAPLTLKSKPQKVGVFVDYEEGLVSFYDVDAAALIYSFTGCKFTEKLFPILRPCEKSGPLIITTVQ